MRMAGNLGGAGGGGGGAADHGDVRSGMVTMERMCAALVLSFLFTGCAWLYDQRRPYIYAVYICSHRPEV